VAFVDVTDPSYKPEQPSGFVDVTDPAYKPAPRTALGEIGTAVKRGAVVDLPSMAGMALQYASSPGNTVYELGKGMRESAEARGASPNLTLRPEEHGAIVNALAEGAQMVPSIAAPVAIGAGALAALPTMPPLAAAALVAGGAALPFAGQAGQSTKEKAEKAGLPEDQATTAARLNAGLTFATQAGLGMVGGQVFGKGAQLFNSIVRKDGGDLATSVLAELTGRAGVVAPFMKQLPVSAAEATVVGGAQAGGSAAVERAYGIDHQDPLEAAIAQAPAMLGLTAVLSPFGLAARGLRANALGKRAEALGNKDTAPAIRDQLATQYFTELHKVDPDAARHFAENADIAIKNGMPLEVDPGLFQQGAVRPPAPPQRTLALPSPYDFVGGAGGVGRDADAVRAAQSGEPEPPPAQRLLPAPPERKALQRSGLPEQATEVHGPTAADLIAAQRDDARAAEENRKSLVETHAHLVDELRTAGVEPTQAMSFPQFRTAMAEEAKKAGLKPDQLTANDYREMWQKHQQDVMEKNFSKAQELAFKIANDNRAEVGESGEAKPKSALAVALEDASKHHQVELAYREREKQRAAELDKLQNVGQGTRLADAAERGTVPASAKTIPSKAEQLVKDLRGVKPDDQAMPPKLMKEVTAAAAGKASFEDQLAALRDLRDSKKPESASYELLDKLYNKMGGDDAIQIQGTAKVDVRQPSGDGKAVGEGNAKPKGVAVEKGKGDGTAQVKRGRPEGTTDDRHTIGPPNEVGELLPYTRTLSQARSGAGGIFGEKQWWQDLAWAVRHPETKIGKELLENGKVTDEQIGAAIARDERYQKADALLEEMRVKREERLRAQILAEAQPEGAKEILKAKDLVNIFGGEEGDYVLDKRALGDIPSKLDRLDNAGVKSIFESGAEQAASRVLEHLQVLAKTPELKRVIEALKKLGLATRVVLTDEVLKDSTGVPKLGGYYDSHDVIVLGKGGASVDTIVHELMHAATVSRIMDAYATARELKEGRISERKLSDFQRAQQVALKELNDLWIDATFRGDEAKREGRGEWHYGLENPLEFVAEAFSNKKFQDFLRSQGPERTMWQRFTDAVKKLLGFRVDNTMLDVANRVIPEFMSAERNAFADKGPSFAASPVEAAARTDNVLYKAAKLADAPLSIKQGFTKAHLYATTLNHIRQVFKDVLPAQYRGALDDYGAAKDRTKMMVEERNRAALEISQKMSALGDKQDKLYRLMGEATRQGVLPDRPINEQPWKAKDASPEKIRKYNELRSIYQANPDIAKVYDAAAAFNKADYDRTYATIVRNLARYSDMPKDLWKKIDVTKGRSAEVEGLEKWLLSQGNDEQRIAMRGALAQYREKQQGPYFHLGRNGSYFTRFTIKDDPVARAAYEKEFGISPLGTDRIVTNDDQHVFARYETVGEWKAVSDKLNKLMAAGHLDPEMQSGQLETMIGKLDSSAPSFVRGLLRNIEADSRLDPDQKRESQDIIRRLAVEMLPETSASKAFAQRKGVAGYDIDMNRSFVKRAASTAYFVAHNSIRPEVEDSMLAMKQGVQALQDATSPHYDNNRGLVASALHNEIKQRQANELLATKTPMLDNVSALSHTFYLAANPAFFMMKTLQPWQLALPQLGARHGFVASFKAMTKATATGLGIIKDTIGDGWQRGQWRGVLDPNIVIDRSRANKDEKAFLKELIAAGGATFTQAHDMGHIAAGDSQGVSTAVKTGNASLHYSEALDRMTAGLAAFNLEMKRTGDFDKATQYGIQMVKNSLYDYNSHNRGRMFSKQGIFGPATPLLTQFAQYQIQTLELLGRLSMDAFGKLDPTMTPAERASAIAEKSEARKALAGIMATTMVLAGTMGLPAVSVLTAAAYNALFSTKDQPADAQSRLPQLPRGYVRQGCRRDHRARRAAGAGSDLGAGHLGFQDIVPFSRFLSRPPQAPGSLRRGRVNMMGPAVGAASGFAYGIQNMLQGRYMKGLEQMLPSGLRAWPRRVSWRPKGLTDLRGNKLPVEINSWDVFNQALNSTPSKVAEQKEAQRGANTTAMLLKQRAMDLKETIRVAAERSDGEEMKRSPTRSPTSTRPIPTSRCAILAGS
jgi:hypothetical protein